MPVSISSFLGSPGILPSSSRPPPMPQELLKVSTIQGDPLVSPCILLKATPMTQSPQPLRGSGLEKNSVCLVQLCHFTLRQTGSEMLSRLPRVVSQAVADIGSTPRSVLSYPFCL